MERYKKPIWVPLGREVQFERSEYRSATFRLWLVACANDCLNSHTHRPTHTNSAPFVNRDMAKSKIKESGVTDTAKKTEAIHMHSRLKSGRAGIIFPATRVGRYLRRDSKMKRMSSDASIYTAATVQYIVSELVELAGRNAFEDKKKKRITPRHLMLAVKTDAELCRLIGSRTMFSAAGVLPHIETRLKKKKRNKKAGVALQGEGNGQVSLTT